MNVFSRRRPTRARDTRTKIGTRTTRAIHSGELFLVGNFEIRHKKFTRTIVRRMFYDAGNLVDYESETRIRRLVQSGGSEQGCGAD